MRVLLRSFLVSSGIVSVFFSYSQCTATLTTQNTCIPAGLRVSFNTTASKIVWNKDNVPVKTVYQSWEKNGMLVCGSPAIGGNIKDMFVDSVGNIYLADANNNAIIKWAVGANTGVIVAGGNGEGSNANQFDNPWGVFVDATGNIYVADAVNDRVQKWAPGAVSGTTVAGGHGGGPAANQLQNPSNVYVTPAGQIYIADFGNNRIQRWAPGAASGVTVASPLGQPFDVCVDGSGNMYIAEYRKITKWNNGAGSGTTLVNDPAILMNLVRTSSGDIYYNTDSAVKRLLNGAASSTIIAGGRSGISPDQLAQATSVGVDGLGNLYCLDLYLSTKSRVLRYKPNTDSSFIAGSAGTYTAVVTSVKGCTSTSNSQVFSATVGPTLEITSPASAVCQGSAVTFNTTLTNGEALAGYQWRKNGTTVAFGSGLSSYTSSNLKNGDTILCIATNNSTLCNARDTMVVQVRPTTNTGQFYASGNCLPSTITLKGSFPSSAILKRDAIAVDSFLVRWNNYGTIVAGGNGLGGNLNQLKYPRDIQVDESGNIYVLDTQNDRLVKYSPGANSGVVVAGGNGPGTALNQLKSPTSFQLTASGEMYIADGRRLVKWLPGASSGVVVMDNSGFGGDIIYWQVFIDARGDCYIATGTDVYRISKDGITKTLVAGGNGSGSANTQLSLVSGLFVDADGFIYISDENNHRVMKWKDRVSYGRVAGTGTAGNGASQLFHPGKLFVDAAKNLYVLDRVNNRLMRYAPGALSGVRVLDFYNATPNTFDPSGMAFDRENNLYVTSSSDSKALKFPATTPAFKTDTAGTYSVKLSGMVSGCFSDVNSIVLNDLQGPSLTLKSAPICAGDVMTVAALVENAGANPSIAWQKNSQPSNEASFTFRDSAASNADVIGITLTKSENNCYVTDSSITVIKPSPAHQLSSVIGAPSTITLQSDMVLPEIRWRWNGQPLDTTHNWKENARTVLNMQGVEGLYAEKTEHFYTASPFGIQRFSVSNGSSTTITTGGFRDVYRKDDSLYAVTRGYTCSFPVFNLWWIRQAGGRQSATTGIRRFIIKPTKRSVCK